MRVRRPGDELADQAAGDRRGQQRVAARDDPQRLQQLVRLGVLEQEPARPGPQRARRCTRRARSWSGSRPARRPAARRATICRVASMPSSTGIWTSTSAMSGRCSAASATACCPSAASPTTSMSSSASSSARMPLRISGWSSASRIRITTAARGGQLGRTLKPPPSRGPACSRPPSAATRSRMPDQPEPPWPRRPTGALGRTVAVVVDLHGQRARARTAAGPTPRLPGVAARRWSAPPARSGTPPGPPRAAAALRPVDRHGHRQPGRAGPVDQAVQLVQPAAVAVLAGCAARRAWPAAPGPRPRSPPGSPAARAAPPRRACGPGARRRRPGP